MITDKPEALRNEIVSLMMACDVDTSKALRMGGKNTSGMLPSWSALAKNILTNEWPDDIKVLASEWGKKWAAKINIQGEATTLMWESWLYECEGVIKNVSTEKLNLDGLEWWIDTLLPIESKERWIKSEYQTDMPLWWCNILQLKSTPGPNRTIALENKIESFKWFLKIAKDIEAPLFRRIWWGMSNFCNASEENMSIVKRHEIENLVSDWGMERLNNKKEVFALNMLHPRQSLDFWKLMFEHEEVKPFTHDDGCWTTRILDRLLKTESDKSGGLGPGVNTVYEKVEWLASKNEWASSLMKNERVIKDLTISWPIKLTNTWLLELERSALNSGNLVRVHKKTEAL